MQIKDIVEFDKSRYFGGAVQANWFYDSERVRAITESYVFHGPKYHGVSEKEATDSRYKLFDTASYALDLLKRANNKDSNRFCLTIAGYGTGKSHLAVTLASLMSGHDEELRKTAIDRIAAVDKDIAAQAAAYTDKNLVLVFNGMNNFNLDYETLSVTKEALKQHGISADVLNSITKQYNQAKHFVETTFDMLNEKYRFYLSEKCPGCEFSKEAIIKKIESDTKVFEAVNEVYKEINGDYIQWDRGISAGDILALVEKTFCREQKIFGKIIILFDEFGRYIEYTAANPAVAGDSSLQQIFEAVQNADGNILFDAFIQSDLNAYLSRIDKSSNIVRYVGRYENSDKYYISSNFETILANLITKKNEQEFKDIVEYNIDTAYSAYHERIHTSLIRWNKNALNRNVWSDNKLYKSVVAKGCYPLHPFAVWFLSNTSEWMQQRSTIAFAEEMFSAVKGKEISAKWIEYIYAVDIIDSALFSEMLNSEEKGLVQSQYCMLYRDIMLKNGDKMSDDEKTVLKAILIINLCKFATIDRLDCIAAIKSCCNLNDAEIEKALNSLENNHGVISFDSNTNRFDLMAEANGMNEFKREFIRKKLMVSGYNGIASCDDELSCDLNLAVPEETAFGFEHKINSGEWCFEKRLMCSSDFNSDYCKSLGYYFNNATDGETSRGIVIYIYCGKTAERDIEYIHKLYLQNELSNVPIILYLLIDTEEKLLDMLRSREALRRFSPSEKDRFARFVQLYNKEYSKKIIKLFRDMLDERKFIGPSGVEISDQRLRGMCTKLYEKIYTKTIPFMFDGFEKKVTPQAKKNFVELCNCMYSGTMTNAQMYQSLTPQLKNRIQAVLSTATTQTSWQVFDSRYRLCDPQNNAVKKIYNDVKEQITPDTPIGIGQLFNKYLYAPYGMNRYCLSLFIIYFICHNSGKIQLIQGDAVIKKSDFVQQVIQNDKKMLEALMRMKIKMSDKTNDDLIEELCRSINENKYVEYCNSLSKQFETMKLELDDTEAYKEKFATIELYLSEGKRLYEQLYTNGIMTAEKVFTEVTEKFSLQKLMGIYAKIQRKTAEKPIDEYSSYLFSGEYCSRVADLLSKADSLLDKNFSSYLKKMTCSISEISQFKSACTKISKQLSKIGRQDYAEALNERVKEIVAEVSLQQKYAQTFAELNKDIAFIGNAESMDFQACEEQLRKMMNWQNFFRQIDDLDKNIIDNYFEKINKSIDSISNKKEQINAEVAKLMDIISSNSADIDDLCSEINRIKALKPNDDIIIKLDNTLALIDEFKRIIQKSEASPKCVSELTNDYNNRWIHTVCGNVMLLHIEGLNQAIEEKRQLWINENLRNIEIQAETMSASECIQWQNKCTDCPDFLNDDDINALNNAQKVINERLKSLKIHGVVEMFNELSADEKKACLEMLSRIVV